jgi:hypothetical protein
MGLFLAMSGVISANQAEVENAMRKFAANNNGSLKEKQLSSDNENCLIISKGSNGITVMYPNEYVTWDETSEFLSRELGKPVFSFHIHDGDLWMYQLFDKGEFVDRFNPVPDYWQELEEDERTEWRGDAEKVAKHIPGLNPGIIANYFIFWGAEIFESSDRKKAYPDDNYFFGDDWQLVDFMQRLGLTYPMDDNGAVLGTTYEYFY